MKRFQVVIHEKGLLDWMNRGRSITTKEDYIKCSPGFFDCSVCGKEDTLNYRVTDNTKNWWVCNPLCAELIILREL